MTPSLERFYGVSGSSIRAKDIFIVRYDGDRQASLPRHTDGGVITCQALLSDNFEGGGTRFWNRWSGQPFANVTPKIFQMTFFPATLNHEGIQVTKGRRYLLIPFLSIDRINPLSSEPTDLSLFASWGSLNWACKFYFSSNTYFIISCQI